MQFIQQVTLVNVPQCVTRHLSLLGHNQHAKFLRITYNILTVGLQITLTALTEPSSSYLGQLAEVSLVDVSSDAIIRVLHVLAHKGEGVGCG